MGVEVDLSVWGCVCWGGVECVWVCEWAKCVGGCEGVCVCGCAEGGWVLRLRKMGVNVSVGCVYTCAIMWGGVTFA